MIWMKTNSLSVVLTVLGLVLSVQCCCGDCAVRCGGAISASAVGFLWVRQQTALWRQCPVFRRVG